MKARKSNFRAKPTRIAIGAALLFSSVVAFGQALPWMNPNIAPEQRAELLVAAMTTTQKAQQLHGDRSAIPEAPECGVPGRHISGIPALKIPTFRITNGPVGLGGGDCTPTDKATALPVALALAASFDPKLAWTFGDLMGRESRIVGVHELEGPGMDMARLGVGGRNFEYLGEDPILAGTIASSEIRGVQQNGIIAMSKHYALNDQEQNRTSVNVDVDQRTLHQIYLLPFEMSVKDGDVASIMCSYNRYGGTYACENNYLMSTVLRDMWGFKGYTQSDFGAAHSTANSLNAGLDLEMPSGTWYTEPRITAALADGSVSMSTVDRALKRRYTQMFRLGIFDRAVVHTLIDDATAKQNGAVSRTIAEQAAVLLKNAPVAQGRSAQPLLPLSPTVRTIALIGQATYANAAVAGGGGSSRVVPTYTVPPLEGLKNVLGQIGSSATVNLVVAAVDGSTNAAAAAAAQAADVAIVMAGVVTSEGRDRPSLSLPDNQDALIAAVAAANPRTVLVLKDGDPVLMPWVDQVPAILEAFNPGQEDGNVVARLLFGVVNPSGKLPVTYPKAVADTPTATADRYPGTTAPGATFPTVHYSEGLAMGYRWYDSKGIAPQFAFGHGLSYSTFNISKLEVTPRVSDGTHPIKVQFFIENNSATAGAEVPQVYLSMPSNLGEPPKRLVAFEKVWLKPGEKRRMEITIDPSGTSKPLSYWDVNSNAWVTDDGTYRVLVGNSSANLTMADDITVRTPAGRMVWANRAN